MGPALWPPALKAMRQPRSAARRTVATTSSADAGYTTATGRWSTARFHACRAASQPSSPGSTTSHPNRSPRWCRSTIATDTSSKQLDGPASAGGSMGPQERNRARDPLELDGADVLEPAARVPRGIRDRPDDEHLAGPRVLRDPRGDVHRLAVVIAFLVEDRPGVELHVGGRQARPGQAVDHLQRARNARPRIPEVEHHAVAEPLDRLAAVLDG